MAVTAADVKNLRDRTNLPMMDCKAALTEVGGDMEKAVDLLRKKFANATAKFAAREAAEGRIAVFIDPVKKVGAILEMRCETAPVVKSDAFVAMVNDLVKHIAEKNPADVATLLTQEISAGKTVQDRISEVIGLIRENMKPERFKRVEGDFGEYIHHDGSVGVLLQVSGPGDAAILRDISMHIAARSPLAALREEVPAELIAKETEIAKDQLANDAKNKNKPANIMEKILEGKLKTWFAENVLIDQMFVKDDSKTIAELFKGMGVSLKGFTRYRVGEK
ncbi:MAG: translation elongation factor Ts [Planctomycetota bacterium]|jgi:elongation factor Ts